MLSPVNHSLHERHQAVLPKWLSLYYKEPLELTHGEGCWVYGGDGRKYLDFFAGILTTMVGHGVPEVVEAVREQAGRMFHTSTLYLSDPMVELAEKIADLSGIPDARVFFTTSGTEANDAALLLATCYRRSNQVLALRNSYHGRSFSTVAITGHRAWSPTSISGLAVSYVHGGYRLRSPFRHLSDEDYTEACVDDLRQVLDMCTSGDAACLIAEPIQGVGGFNVLPDGFFGAMKKELDQSGILWISDEVQTGWGRTGDHFWGYQASGAVPDILTFAKGVGNGLALGGVVARAEIMDCLGANSISTFGGNPLACAGALATLDYVITHNLQANAAARGAQFRAGLEAIAADCDWIVEARGRGLMQAVETVEPGGLTPAPGKATALLEATRKQGLLVGKGGLYGNVVRVAPPMTVSADEVDQALTMMADAVSRVADYE